MNLSACQSCGHLLHFENARCSNCSHWVGFHPGDLKMVTLESKNEIWRTMAAPVRHVRFCKNVEHDACNWLVDDGDPELFCVACRHNKVIPDLSSHRNFQRWRLLEIAKRRLFYTLLRFGLPPTRRPADPEGLVFDFLSDPNEGMSLAPTVLTGHEDGLITINIAEADDAEREARRTAMGEPYRTLLGHFRHEVGHYYWNELVRDAGGLDAFREFFGDERRDYGESLQVYYADGPPADWPDRFVSAYATSHPWEDWAETFAHYLHMVDTLETVSAFGIGVNTSPPGAQPLKVAIDFDIYNEPDISKFIAAWLPLTFALNSITRSMGQPDLYPFALEPLIVGKLAFVHQRIAIATGRPTGDATDISLFKAIVAALRKTAGDPPGT
ncbi:MAG: putative zinc-binding peptidase [Afipia sp.]|nr:putative zinc-binding peptidase [Afipia sp.]